MTLPNESLIEASPPSVPNVTAALKPLPAFEIPVDSITTGDRVRNDLGDIDDLAASVELNGLIQPIIVTADHRLVAGERRLRAHKKLGWKFIKACYIEVLDDGHRAMLEATENLVRRDFNWKETVLAIDKVHRLKTTENALRGEAWGIRETGRLLNTAKSSINRATILASYIRANDPEVCAAENLKDAFAVIFKREEDRLSAALVKSSLPKTPPRKELPAGATEEVGDDDLFARAGTTGFVPGVGGILDTEEIPGGLVSIGGTNIPLSRMFFNTDAVDFCKQCNPESFDAVITDWPYGIDMDNIQQDGGGKSIDTTRTEHDVRANEQLHGDIIPEIFRLLRTNGWFITWTDMEQWKRNCELAEGSGFKVQSWPLVWHKTSACQNMAARYNWTKNFEVALVCRKGNATLLEPRARTASSVWTGGNDTEARALGHPFCKPFGLWEWLFTATCLRGASVLDPFVGCGSSVIPAIRLGLRPVGVEINATHFASLNVNLQNFYRSLDPTCTFS